MDPREARNYIGTHHVYNQPKPKVDQKLETSRWWNKTQPIQIMRQTSLTEAASSPGSASPPMSPASSSGFSYPGQPQAPTMIKPKLYKSLSFTD